MYKTFSKLRNYKYRVLEVCKQTFQWKDCSEYLVFLVGVATETEVLTLGAAGSAAQVLENICCQDFFIFIQIFTL